VSLALAVHHAQRRLGTLTRLTYRAASPQPQTWKVADLIVSLASSRSSYTSGVVVDVDGGLSARHAP
jgi:NAD(P)-dependent dehydrogenase (short-subunit alcohol dehydrogenase family)